MHQTIWVQHKLRHGRYGNKNPRFHGVCNWQNKIGQPPQTHNHRKYDNNGKQVDHDLRSLKSLRIFEENRLWKIESLGLVLVIASVTLETYAYFSVSM